MQTLKKKRTIALFDFDGTITRHDSFRRFAQFALGTPAFIAALLRTAPSLLAWKCRIITNGQAKEKLFSTLFAGMSAEHFNKLCATFADKIDSDLRPDVAKIMKSHIDSGDTIYIITASIDAWVRPWATRNGIAHVIGTKIEIDSNGRITGRFASPNCYGAEKVRRLLEKEPTPSECEFYAYGNDSGDAEMLAFATVSKLV